MRPRTTVCCTVGPASAEPETLRSLVEAGARVFRINGGLVSADDLPRWVERIRAAAAAAGAEVGILLDLPGSGLRLGTVEGEGRYRIRPGERLRLDDDPAPAAPGRASLARMALLEEVRPGQAVYLGDGRERLEVVAREGGALLLEVKDGGEVRTGMGIHVPGLALASPVPTREDRRLLVVGLSLGVDLVAQSFVRGEADVARVNEVLAEHGARHVPVLAKIERLEAFDALDRIVDRADGVIVARGDLGIDAGVERVPVLQRRVVEACRRAARPVMIATEMLGSMTHAPRPTRAEASDVAGAVFEGADAVLLSAETALGVDPVRAAATMARILVAAEEDAAAPHAGSVSLPGPTRRAGRPDQHVVRAAVDLARDVGARVIVAYTRQGSSAFRLSKERPRARILALAPTTGVVRRLSLAWGVEAVRIQGGGGTDAILADALARLREDPDVEAGDLAVAVMGGAKDPAGATTLIKLLHL